MKRRESDFFMCHDVEDDGVAFDCDVEILDVIRAHLNKFTDCTLLQKLIPV